jgi:hypothetical protein
MAERSRGSGRAAAGSSGSAGSAPRVRNPWFRPPGEEELPVGAPDGSRILVIERLPPDGGYPTMINDALRAYLGKATSPVDEEALRRVIREELGNTG